MAILRIFALFSMVFVSVFNYLDTCHAQPRRSTVACIFYEHTNAKGRVVSDGLGRSAYIGGGLNDEVSTIWVKRGYKVTIFKDNNYRGSRRVLHSSYRRGWRGDGGTYFNLKPLNFNDRLTSYIIERERPRHNFTGQAPNRRCFPVWPPHQPHARYCQNHSKW